MDKRTKSKDERLDFYYYPHKVMPIAACNHAEKSSEKIIRLPI
ncbi:hypothetical protein [Pedobacter changchengzhani]|nr:hypothetical protein [Pedobacter changchengzhani]